MKKSIHLAGVALAAVLVVTPAFASAHEKGNLSFKSDHKISGSLFHFFEKKHGSHDPKNATTTAARQKAFLEKRGAVGAGLVTAISGSNFVVGPFAGRATSTVTTNASTTYLINGKATTSAALTAGSKVILMGTSTSDTSITASVVQIIGKGFGFVKHCLHLK